MTAKEYLNQIRTLEAQITQKMIEMDTLYDKATAIGSFDYSRDRVQTSPSSEAPYARVMERASELDEEIRKLVDRRLEIINSIYILDDARYIDVLYKIYAEGKYYSTIASEMDYSYDRVRHLHYDALDALELKLDLL